MIHDSTRTKIVATIGPASSSYEVLRDLVVAGVDVFRLNFSHGSHEDKKTIIDLITSINQELSASVAILADLQGPKIRTGEMELNTELKTGSRVIFTTEKMVGNSERLYISYESFSADIKVGDRILIDDGKVELRATRILSATEVEAEVMFGGVVSSKKGINLPDTNISMPSLTIKDIQDLDFILQQPIHWIALSFVRRAGDVEKLRKRIQAQGHQAKIIAKIEKPEAYLNIDSIITAADAIMVARGDLGVEMPVEQVPSIQKDIVRRCNAQAVPVIIATQMMESMTYNSSPTRAEVTDVANAIYDGADAVMLSGETATGIHPVKVIETMHRIMEEAEKEESIYDKDSHFDPTLNKYLSDTICASACDIANRVNASAIIGMTKSGYSAFKLSSHRPKAPIFMFTENADILNELNLLWGVRAFYYNSFNTTDTTIAEVEAILLKKGLVKEDDVVIFTGSMPLKERGSTNTIKVDVIGSYYYS
ncbi:MAG: pyruvate kinase [Sphingobacteriales bacterium]|nr:pyruvate kinase [Sphingobacteriales bacterium]